MTLIEKAARAGYEKRKAAAKLPAGMAWVPWEELPDEAREIEIAAMRAGVETLREPTEEMLAARVYITDLGSGPPHYSGSENRVERLSAAAYTTMIDAILLPSGEG